MNRNTNYRAWGSVGHYIQGPHLLDKVKDYSDLFGHKHAYIIDVFFYKTWRGKLERIYNEKNGDSPIFLEFEGEITNNHINDFCIKLKEKDIDVVIAIGGGKSIDIAKMISNKILTSLVICPTIASTDAPTSAMSIIYTDQGEMNEIIPHKKNPDLVLVDSYIISQAPVRFLISGMGDALSTYFEGLSNSKSNHENYVWYNFNAFSATITGKWIARACYETLIRDGLLAKLSSENHVVTTALENIIECNILMSGLGFENVGCSVAHAIGNAITVLPDGENKMHGERVGFGVICQLVAENMDKETIDQVMDFCIGVGLPVTFEDLEISITQENLEDIAEASLKAASWDACNFSITKNEIINIMITADSLGKFYKNHRKQSQQYKVNF